MDLATATRYSEKIVEWIAPYCRRVEVAGSVRRRRPECADVDIVCDPKVSEEKDMLGAVVKRDNLLLCFLRGYVAGSDGKARFVSGGEVLAHGHRESKQVILELPKCQLDLWFADETTWGTRLLCRTGSKEHNVWLCQRAIERNGKWSPYDGLEVNGVMLPCPEEACIYAGLGLEFIKPENREADWIRKNLEFGI